jgi:hypothetical protein
MHLEADGTCAGLAFALACGAFAEVGKIFLANAFEREMLGSLVDLLLAAGVDVDLEMHFGLAVQTLQVALELALVGADGFSQAFVILKDSSKTEREDGRVFEAVSDNSGVIDACFLIHDFGGIVFADNDS